MSDCIELDEREAILPHEYTGEGTSATVNEQIIPSNHVTVRSSDRVQRGSIDRKWDQSRFSNGPFTETEKEHVLAALYQYGCNVDKIAPCVKTRTREQVKDFLTGWFRKISKLPVIVSEQDKASPVKEPIELWLKEMKKGVRQDEGDLPIQWLSRAFGLIAKLEKHPTLQEAGGVDFRKLYQFLETMLNGSVTPNLDYENTFFILSSFKQLRSRVAKINFYKDETFLKRPYTAKPRTYKRVKREDVTGSLRKKEFEELLSTKVFNPIGFPIENLTVGERLKSQSLF